MQVPTVILVSNMTFWVESLLSVEKAFQVAKQHKIDAFMAGAVTGEVMYVGVFSSTNG